MLIFIDDPISTYPIDRSKLKRNKSNPTKNEIQTPFGPIVYRKLGPAKEDPVRIFRFPMAMNSKSIAYAARALGGTRVIGIIRDAGVERPSTPTNFIEFTNGRPTTFFETIGTGYVQQNPPFCPELQQTLLAAGVQETGNLLVLDSLPAPDIQAWWQAHQISLISTETQPEGSLCRELELCYAVLALPETMMLSTILAKILSHLPFERSCECDQTMAMAKKFGKLTADWFEKL